MENKETVISVVKGAANFAANVVIVTTAAVCFFKGMAIIVAAINGDDGE